MGKEEAPERGAAQQGDHLDTLASGRVPAQGVGAANAPETRLNDGEARQLTGSGGSG